MIRRVDASFEALAQSVFERFEIPFQLLLLPRNLGFAPANNIGLKAARGKFRLLSQLRCLSRDRRMASLADRAAFRSNIPRSAQSARACCTKTVQCNMKVVSTGRYRNMAAGRL